MEPLSPEHEPADLTANPGSYDLRHLDLRGLSTAVGALLQDFVRNSAGLDRDNVLDRPLCGVTVYLAHTQIQTRMGPFTAYIFQDIIHKGYIIALTFGNIQDASLLATRLHSSCVTSETLRGCDCDCVQQLEGAFQHIADVGAGILFYLLQEGRGVGYAAKARDRMLVQATHDEITTFDAYALLGLNKDYRNYRNIPEICRILNIDVAEKEWILLTNNPDKLAGIQALGLNVARMEAIEYEPGPFNLAYLQSKAASGHQLDQPSISKYQPIRVPDPTPPFRPSALPHAQRFIYMACYSLPILPVDDVLAVSFATFNELFDDVKIDNFIRGKTPIIQEYHVLRKHRFHLKINREALEAYMERFPDAAIGQLLTTPYWFKVHVYFDTVTGEDFVMLTYGDIEQDDVPIVRLQSESILNRFPLVDTDNKNKYNTALRKIVEYGCGVIMLVYHDGRGAGFGAHSVDRMLVEKKQARDSRQAYEKLAVHFDSRDYEALMTLLTHHLPPENKRIQLVLNSPSSLVLKKEFAEALQEQMIEVAHWHFLDVETVTQLPYGKERA